MRRNVTTTDGQRISLPAPAWTGTRDLDRSGAVWMSAIYLSGRARPPRIVQAIREIVSDGGDTRTRYEIWCPGDHGYPGALALLDELDVDIPPALEVAAEL